MPIYDWLEAIEKPEFKRMVYNYYTWIKETFHFKKRKQNEKLFNIALTLFLWVKELFLVKIVDLAKDDNWYQNVYFLILHTTYVCVLT